MENNARKGERCGNEGTMQGQKSGVEMGERCEEGRAVRKWENNARTEERCGNGRNRNASVKWGEIV